jgi:hypothetical protein
MLVLVNLYYSTLGFFNFMLFLGYSTLGYFIFFQTRPPIDKVLKLQNKILIF